MRGNATILGTIALIAVVVVCCAALVYGDKLDGTLFVGVVVGPVITGGVAVIAGVKGVQQGSQATSNPPPQA